MVASSRAAILPRMIRRHFVRLAALGLVALAPARATESSLTARLDGLATAAMERRRFMGAVLVVRDGAALLDRAYGSASLELEVPNTPATRFRIGSITKQFTAAAILLLEERGLLRVDDLLARHVPEAPAAWAGITLYQLLTHTSGIRNITALPEFRTWAKLPQTPREAVERLRDLPLDFPPGEKFAYSNSNYLLLGLVVERVSGRAFAAFLHDNVLDPLGLRDTDVDNNTDLVPRRAAGHAFQFGSYLRAPYSDMTVPHAAGAMYSTTHDLRRWIEGLLSGQLLTPASVARMITPEKGGYALGLQVSLTPRKVIRHGGSIAGFSAFLAHYPDERLTVVVLSNVMGPTSEPLARQLAETAIADRVTGNRQTAP